MNIRQGAAIAAAGLVAGVGLVSGLSGQPSPQSSPQSSPQNQVVESLPAVNPPAASPVVQHQRPAVQISFDQLSPCEQIESVAKSGKSVSEFLVAANRVNDLAKYKVAIGSVCPWNAEQLQVADRLINPPVVVAKRQIMQESSRSSASERADSAQQSCDPSYPSLCLPVGSADLDCGDVSQSSFAVRQPDPHRFDRDKDGIGCEA
jgi:hypothetical protein